MTFNELISELNNTLSQFADQVGMDVVSDNLTGITSFNKATGSYIDSPLFPYTSGTIPLDITKSVRGGISSIWYKGGVLTKADFTGGVIVMFTGINVLDELCRVFIDYDKTNNAFSVNIQTGFTGDLPPSGETAPLITVTDPIVETAPIITVN